MLSILRKTKGCDIGLRVGIQDMSHTKYHNKAITAIYSIKRIVKNQDVTISACLPNSWRDVCAIWSGHYLTYITLRVVEGRVVLYEHSLISADGPQSKKILKNIPLKNLRCKINWPYIGSRRRNSSLKELRSSKLSVQHTGLEEHILLVHVVRQLVVNYLGRMISWLVICWQPNCRIIMEGFWAMSSKNW